MSVIRMLAIGFCLAMGIAAAGATADEPGWRSLFNGRDLEGWQPTPFGGNGEVRVVDGAIHVAVGSELSGITWQRDIPRTNIEIAIEARRDEGFDFFCGLTFPVGEGSCSFIVGGWGGTVVGLSSIDGLDASQNATTTSEIFTSGQWYRIRVRSMPDRIECYIDDKRVVDQTVADHQFMVRDEMLPARPLGIATYATAASLRDLRWRVIDPP
ncbi:MAG: DUF1080 domain-containing protein [Planctomycetia bacterium]